MRKLIGLNWKMNPATPREAEALTRAMKEAGKRHAIVIFPPFVFLPDVAKMCEKKVASVGAQNFSPEPRGAYTGEVSLPMLKRFGVRYALVGHSERRKYFNETDEAVRKKFRAALQAGITPILCVGEPWAVRKKGTRAAEAYVKRQLMSALKAQSSRLRQPALRRWLRQGEGFGGQAKPKTRNFIIAYEPVWAIGTGRACALSDAVKMARVIKKILKAQSSRLRRGFGGQAKLKVSVLYGGSVDSRNVNSFVGSDAIDGALVGGASANLKKLRAMMKKIHG